MSDNNQNSNPSPPPQKPTTLRMPVTRLAPQPAPPVGKPAECLAPPEEPTVEPWEETDAGEGDLKVPNKPAVRLNSAAQLRRPAANPPVGRSSPYPPEPRTNQAAETRSSTAADLRASLSLEPRTDQAPVPRASSPVESRSGPPSETRAQILPRMELKPVLPSDPARSGVNVVPSRPRVSIPPSRFGGSGSPATPTGSGQPSRLAQSPQPAPIRLAGSAGSASVLAPAAVSTPLAGLGGVPAAAPELASILERLANLPAQTAILGVCDDRLPVLLDLSDPAPGALLVASDDETLRLRLLRTLLQTAAALNSPRSVQFLVLSTRPEEWRAWLDELDISRHCLGIDSLLEGSPDRWLLKLAGWADQRRTGSSGPAVILVVDDLTAVPQMEYDARVNFDWLVKEGPGVRIWPVGAMAVEQAPDLVRWVRLFKTRILGPAVDPALYRQLASLDEQEGAALVDEMQFAVRIHDNWLKFRIPLLPGETA